MHVSKARTLTAAAAVALTISLLLPISSLAQAPDNGQSVVTAAATTSSAPEITEGEPSITNLESVVPEVEIEVDESTSEMGILAELQPPPVTNSTNWLPDCGGLHTELCFPGGSTCACSDGFALGSCYCTTDSVRADGLPRWECAF